MTVEANRLFNQILISYDAYFNDLSSAPKCDYNILLRTWFEVCCPEGKVKFLGLMLYWIENWSVLLEHTEDIYRDVIERYRDFGDFDTIKREEVLRRVHLFAEFLLWEVLTFVTRNLLGAPNTTHESPPASHSSFTSTPSYDRPLTHFQTLREQSRQRDRYRCVVTGRYTYQVRSEFRRKKLPPPGYVEGEKDDLNYRQQILPFVVREHREKKGDRDRTSRLISKSNAQALAVLDTLSQPPPDIPLPQDPALNTIANIMTLSSTYHARFSYLNLGFKPTTVPNTYITISFDPEEGNQLISLTSSDEEKFPLPRSRFLEIQLKLCRIVDACHAGRDDIFGEMEFELEDERDGDDDDALETIGKWAKEEEGKERICKWLEGVEEEEEESMLDV